MSLPVLLMLLIALPAARPGSQQADRYLEAALQGLEWVASTGVPDGAGGTRYPVVPAEEASPTDDSSLYHGLPGPALAFLQAEAATGDPVWARRAEEALRGMYHAWQEAGGRDAGLYSGAAGVGSVLLTASDVGETHAWTRAAARAVGDSIVAWARPDDGGVTWNEVVDIIAGNAGTGLFLLRLAEVTGDPRYFETARQAGSWLHGKARRDADGLWWPIDGAEGLHYPNFSHGTAGVAYFLGYLAAALPDGEAAAFIADRTAGTHWLQSNGSDVCVVYHHAPGGEDLQYWGWCHGPVGTARLLLQEPSVPTDALSRAAARLLERGPEPGTSPDGYWNNVSVCCGTAGMLDFLIDCRLAGLSTGPVARAVAYADVLLERAHPMGSGLEWPQAEHRVRPDFIQAQTGWMQGAAGIAASLIRYHLVTTGHPERILRLPDEVRLP